MCPSIRKRLSPISSTWLGILTLGIFALAPSAWASVLVVDSATGPYTNLQNAVTAANPGDTIVVHNNASPQFLTLMVQGKEDLRILAADEPSGVLGPWQSGVGHSGNGTFGSGGPSVLIDGGNAPVPCIAIVNSDRVTIAGFEISNCQQGIRVQNSDDVRIVANEVHATVTGIVVISSRRTVISGNWLHDTTGGDGIRLDSKHGFVYNNVIEESIDTGIWIFPGSSGVQVLSNQLISNGAMGLYDQGSLSCIERNEVLGNGAPNLLSTSGNASVVGNETGGGNFSVASPPSFLSDNN